MLFDLFPAYAGVILTVRAIMLESASFPRIRGGDPKPHAVQINTVHFSPHTRG